MPDLEKSNVIRARPPRQVDRQGQMKVKPMGIRDRLDEDWLLAAEEPKSSEIEITLQRRQKQSRRVAKISRQTALQDGRSFYVGGLGKAI